MGTHHVYTDGSAHGNGTSGSRAGYGAYFGDNDSRNSSGPVHGQQTNNAAELSGIRAAMDTIGSSHRGGDYVIHTDSSYSKNAVTGWADKWESNGWQTSSGGSVKNQDLIQDIRSSHRDLADRGINVRYENCGSHGRGPYGNQQADRMANDAARGRYY